LYPKTHLFLIMNKSIKFFRRNILAILILLVSNGCSSGSKAVVPEVSPEVPISVLNKNGIATINENYKRNYFRILPYLFYNKADAFNEIQGDFYNVKYYKVSNINIMVGFWSEYEKYKNSLVVLITLTNTSSLPIKDVSISVSSSKNGYFKKGSLDGKTKIERIQQRVLFVNELELENKLSVLDKIDDDVITVTINGQDYVFLNPEMKLE